MKRGGKSLNIFQVGFCVKVMICNKCGKTINDDSVFCEYCGNKIEIKKEEKKKDGGFCRYCGAQISDGMQFCYKCGKPVSKGSNKEVNYTFKSGAGSIHIEKRGAFNSIANSINNNSFIKMWGFKICGAIGVISFFLPIIDYGFYSESSFGLILLLFQSNEMHGSAGMVFVIFGLIVHLIVSIALILSPTPEAGRSLSITGLVIVLCLRILPNMFMSMSIQNEYGFGIDLIQYGFGWWGMFIAFIAALILSVAMTKKQI